jgi:hypothetical protein
MDGIAFNDHIAEEGSVVFAHACKLAAEGIVSKPVDSCIGQGRTRRGQDEEPGRCRDAVGAQGELEAEWSGRGLIVPLFSGHAR